MLKIRHSALALLLALSLGAPGVSVYARPDTEFDKAKELFDNGMYASARAWFEKHADDPLCADYAVLCAVKLRTQDCGRLVEQLDAAHPKTLLNSQIHFEYARILYSEGNYSRACEEFAIDKASSYFVGDTESDMACARNAGIRGVRYEGGSLLALVRDAVE